VKSVDFSFYITLIVGFSLIYYGYVRKLDNDLKKKQIELEEKKLELEMKMFEVSKEQMVSNEKEGSN